MRLIGAFLATSLCAQGVWAQGPENVLVVMNRDSKVSRDITSYYARRRAVPANHVCRIAAPESEQITRWTYENRVEREVRGCLEREGLVESILYIVTTAGVPLKVAGSSGAKATGASVDGELALLYGKIHGAEYPLESGVDNPFFRQRDVPFRHPRFPIYLVTRLAAYDTDGVRALIDRGLQARNRGRVVLDLKSASDEPGNNWLRTAAVLLPKDRVIVEESEAVLYDQREVIGYASWGSNDPGRKRRRLGFHWLPGAIATEYVSTNGRTFSRPPDQWTFGTWGDRSGWFSGSPQSLTADLIDEGASGASGHVYEPYLQGTPRPDYLFPAYLGGRTLAESYYMAIPALSWMNIVVGDPLARLR